MVAGFLVFSCLATVKAESADIPYPTSTENSWAASAPVEINQWIRHIFDDDNQRVSDHPEPLYDVSVGDGRVLRSRGKSDSILLLGMIR